MFLSTPQEDLCRSARHGQATEIPKKALITRFSAGNVKASLAPAEENRSGPLL
jgi:hypothetical protein